MIVTEEQIKKSLSDIDENFKVVEEISNSIISKYTSDLDELMKAIQEDIVIKENPEDSIVQKYFLELTNALYFINSRCEYLGFYQDLSKSALQVSYNNGYTQNIVEAASTNKKPTVADNQIAADTASLSEKVANIIYTRSFSVVKQKLDAASEMVKTLSKILSKHMTEIDRSNFTQQIINN